MKIASTIFSWLGGIVNLVYGLIFLFKGVNVNGVRYSYAPWVWFLFFAFIIANIVILIWRQIVVENGDRAIACGVFTIIFVSIIGGILTLFVKEADFASIEANKEEEHKLNLKNIKYTQKEASELINANKNLLSKGIITKEEYDQRVMDISANIKE